MPSDWTGFLPPNSVAMSRRAWVHRPAPARESVAPEARESLVAISTEIGDCRRCPLSVARKSIVFGEGNPSARLVIVGEGPGEQEDLSGRPFVGAAGQLLDRMIEAIGLKRSDVYICNVVKCRPPGNRNPEPVEVEACSPFLARQLDSIRPELILALGKFAAQTLLTTTEGIIRLRGKIREYRGISLMPSYHPAYLLRNPAAKKEAWADLQAVAHRLGLEIPARNKES